MTVRTEYFPKNQYDQCGLIVRLDSDNWIKTSTEFETEKHSRLGSVVTNLGYSDWATIDVHAFVTHMEYRIQSQHHLQDFLIEYSENGQQWNQLRITHLHKKIETLDVGVYACSPMNGSFEVCFDSFALEQSHWQEY